jgi:polyphosphate kinase
MVMTLEKMDQFANLISRNIKDSDSNIAKVIKCSDDRQNYFEEIRKSEAIVIKNYLSFKR